MHKHNSLCIWSVIHLEIVPNTQKKFKKQMFPAKCSQMYPLVKVIVWILSTRKKPSVNYIFIYIMKCFKEPTHQVYSSLQSKLYHILFSHYFSAHIIMNGWEPILRILSLLRYKNPRVLSLSRKECLPDSNHVWLSSLQACGMYRKWVTYSNLLAELKRRELKT